MNNTLEEINSRITEAEEWMNSDLENRRVEITATEQNIGKRMKTKNEQSLRETSRTTLNTSTFTL